MSSSTKSRSRPPSRNSLLLLLALLLSVPTAAATAADPSDTSCVDVQVGSARSYDCINRNLRRRVQAIHPPADDSTLTATAAPNRVGTFNQSATREYLGASFGHSAVPPPQPRTSGPALGIPSH